MELQINPVMRYQYTPLERPKRAPRPTHTQQVTPSAGEAAEQQEVPFVAGGDANLDSRLGNQLGSPLQS